MLDGLLLGFVLYITLEVSAWTHRIELGSTSTFLDRLMISGIAAVCMTTILTLIGPARSDRGVSRFLLGGLAGSVAFSISIAVAVDAFILHVGTPASSPELVAGGMAALALIVVAHLLIAQGLHEIAPRPVHEAIQLAPVCIRPSESSMSHGHSASTTVAASSTRVVLAEEPDADVEIPTLAAPHRRPVHGAMHLVTVEEGTEIAEPVWISTGLDWPRRSPRSLSRTLKRAIDLVVGATSLTLLSPLMVVLAILIKLESRGPALFVQTRIGINGTTFDLLKFRSMRLDAEECTGPVFATRNDPRCTRIGRFMRRHSLDELPQLINVVRGDMSIVGPRPERPYFVVRFSQTIPHYAERHREKAGITGWAQVNGRRGDTSIEERVQYDLYYVENWSLAFDLKIMVRTVVEIFQGHNAY